MDSGPPNTGTSRDIRDQGDGSSGTIMRSEPIPSARCASATLAASSNIQATLMGQLLPQDNQSAWSTNYSIPMCSSFVNHLDSYENNDQLIKTMRDHFINGGGEQVNQQLSSFDNPIGIGVGYHRNTSRVSQSSHSDTNRPDVRGSSHLINKLNRATNSDRGSTLYSTDLKTINSIAPVRTSHAYSQSQPNSFMPNQSRSYSSVLHSGRTATELPFMPQHHQQQRQYQLSNIFDLQDQQMNDKGGSNKSQTGLIIQPTNNSRQQNNFINQLDFQSHQQLPALPHHQVRHLSDFISSINQQHQHQAQNLYQPFNPVNNLGQFGTIGANLGHHRQHHSHNQRQTGSQEKIKSFQASTSNIGASTSSASTKRKSKPPFFPSSSDGTTSGNSATARLELYGSALMNSDGGERFSRKVFVGGLPPDIDEEEIKVSFKRFGLLLVDWPHKAESKSYFPPKGYAFLLFQEESSVQALIDACLQEDDKLYLCVSSPTIKDKPVQIRPWRLSDADFVLDSTLALDPRKTVFVGGVPRPLKASELATIMNNLYGSVCYAGIDTDPDLKYPKGAGRVAFSNHQSYIAAISARFVHIHHSEIEKRVEVKPYVLDDQLCDECQGSRCGNKFAPFFCANITCLRYYCDNCWSDVHSQPGREFHKPLVKEGADRPRGGGQSNIGSCGSSRNSGPVNSDNIRKHNYH